MKLCKLNAYCLRFDGHAGPCKLSHEYDQSEPPTPAESPAAKRRDSLWKRVSGAPRRTLRPREVGGLAAVGGMLALATGAVDYRNPTAVVLIAAAWLAFAGATWLSRRL